MTAKKKPAKRGRPPIDNPASLRLNIRVTPEQRERYARKAAKRDLTLTAFVLDLLDRA